MNTFATFSFKENNRNAENLCDLSKAASDTWMHPRFVLTWRKWHMHSFNTSLPPLILWPNPWLIYFNLSLGYRRHQWHGGQKFCRRTTGQRNESTNEGVLELMQYSSQKTHTQRGNYGKREDSAVFKCHPTWSKHGAWSELCCCRDLG